MKTKSKSLFAIYFAVSFLAPIACAECVPALLVSLANFALAAHLSNKIDLPETK